MKNLIIEINERLKEINELITESTLQLGKHPQHDDIHVLSCLSHGRTQFYYIDSESQKKVFIKANELKKYTKYIQRDYDFAVNKELLNIQKKLIRISKDLKYIDLSQIKSIYNRQAPSKKLFITPIIESDDDYINRWYENNCGGKNTYPIDGKIYTARGEQVRSKSEKILADLFNKYNIPYVYEPKLVLKNGRTIYPDFAVLNIRTRQTIYWEHLGLINMEDYAVKNMEKIHEYIENNYMLGDNLLISMESTINGLNTKMVEKQIQDKCM